MNVSTSFLTSSFIYDFAKDGNGDSLGNIRTGLQIPNGALLFEASYFTFIPLVADSGDPQINVGTITDPTCFIFFPPSDWSLWTFGWQTSNSPIFIHNGAGVLMDNTYDVIVNISGGKLKAGKFMGIIQYFIHP